MKNLFKILTVLLLLCGGVARADEIRSAGGTSQCVDVKILNSSVSTGAGKTALTSATSGFGCYYHRSSAATSTQIVLVGGTIGSFVSSGFIEVDATNQPGVYQLCPPNAAFAAGASYVDITCQGSANVAQMDLRILLSPSVNLVSSSASSIPETAFAPTNLFGTGSTTTALQLAAGETSNDITGQTICATSGLASKTCRPVTVYNTSTKVATVSPAYTNAPANGDGYSLGDYVANGSVSTCPTAADIWTYVTRTVASVSGAVGSVTGNVGGNVVGNVNGNVVGSVGSIGAGGITSASYGTDVIGHTKTAVAASTTAMTLAVGETYGDKSLNNNTSILIASSSNGIWQNACVCNYASATRIATFCVPLKIAPTGTVKYSVLPWQNCNLQLYPGSH